MADQSAKRKELVEKLWHRQKPDAGTTDAEKAQAREKIEQILNLSGMEGWKAVFNWTTGKFDGKQSATGKKADAKPKTDSKSKTDAKPKANTDGQWTTADLTAFLNRMFGKSWTPKDIRRILRTMDRYNDGKTTHYSWTGQNDPLVQEVVDFIKGKKSGKSA